MMVTKLGVNHMLEKQVKGSIINIGSVAALRGFAAGKCRVPEIQSKLALM